MKSVIIAVFLLISTTAYAENVTPLMEKLLELNTRIDLGISLNSFAESVAAIKIEQNKAITDGITYTNPLLAENLAAAMKALEDYGRAWKIYEVDGFKFVNGSGYPGYDVKGSCDKYGCQTAVSDIKAAIYKVYTEKVLKAGSIHLNGW